MSPRGNRLLEGDLAIELDESLYDAQVQTTGPLITLEDTGPWGKQTADYAFAQRGQPLAGKVRLQSRRPRVRARCTTDVALQGQEAAVVHRLLLQPEVGQAEVVDLFVTGPGQETWEWKTIEGGNSLRKVEHLPGMALAPDILAVAAPTPLHAAVLLGGPVRTALAGSWWRLTLARPLREPVTLEAIYHQPLQGHGQEFRFVVPLPTIPGRFTLRAR